ncbi:GRF1-interacting factor 3-like [Vicia villosa]|uniref:GRF1-interacting factor 3-like n=1 Tax=Vicia villosa TaxID=3911 RepID=UPI00273ABD9F|nr:GRF1-interacting factor 3-like [Vicia villosa]
MMNGDPSLSMLSTEQIQKYLEENKELILAIMEGKSQGKYAEIAPYQTKLQDNLTFLARLADFDSQPEPQAQMHSQGQGMQRLPQVAMSQQRPDFSIGNTAFDMNEQQQQQQHLAMPSQQPDLSTSKLAFQMNEQQHYKQPAFIQQRQLFPEGMNSFSGTNNSSMQTRTFNLPDTPSFNQMGSDAGPGWS